MEDALKQIAGIAILTSLILLVPSTLPANASTTRVWEPVNIAGAGLDTLANNSTVTVSFGKAGRYDVSFGNAAVGALYLTDGTCGSPTCTASDIDGTVRFTFGTAQTHVQIHYAYVDFDDPERVISNLGPVNLTNTSPGTRVASTGGLIAGQLAANNLTSAGLIYPSSGVASGTVELRFPSPGVEYIEFQNDFPEQGTFRSGGADYGQNLVGVSLPVEYAQVTFNANSGAGTMSAQSAAKATNLSSNTFNYSGYTFAGWNTAANGSGTPFADGASFGFTADTVFFAQWTLIPVATPTQTLAAPAPAILLASTGAEATQAILIGGVSLFLITTGLVIFGIRRKLGKAEKPIQLP